MSAIATTQRPRKACVDSNSAGRWILPTPSGPCVTGIQFTMISVTICWKLIVTIAR